MLNNLRRRLATRLKPEDDTVRRLLASPLNDTAEVVRVFGRRDPGADVVRARYFDLPVAQRPRLSPYFDASFYLAANADVDAAGVDPYLHFLGAGLGEGRDPHPLVDLTYVGAQRLPTDPALDAAALAALLRGDQVRPHPLFDPAWYLEQNPDVRTAGVPALAHYVLSGAGEGRRPNAYFDVDWYRSQPGLPHDRYEAFVHFVRHGDAEGLRPGPEFDGAGYRRQHPELADSTVGSLAHFLAGWRDGISLAQLKARAATRVPAATGASTGSFDLVADGAAAGWAWNPAKPDERLIVEIIADGQVVGRGRADGPRPDLRKLGMGDGAYHFQIRIADDIADGRPHRLTARVAGDAVAVIHGAHEFRAIPTRDFALVPVAASESLARAFARAGGQDGEAIAAQIGEAALHLATGRTDEATVLLRRLEAEGIAAPVAALKLGDALLCAGDTEGAQQAYSRATRDPVTAGWAHLGLGGLAQRRGDWQSAEDHYAQARTLAPDLPMLTSLTDAMRARGTRAEARHLATAGDPAAALQRVLPELLATPEDPALCDLATTLIAMAEPDAEPERDPELARARRALKLLEAVLDEVERKRSHPA